MGGLPIASENATCSFRGHIIPASRAGPTLAAPKFTAPIGRSPLNELPPLPAIAGAGATGSRGSPTSGLARAPLRGD
eukprot:2251852-Pleurochrysis_carterae.AAC.2